MNKKVKALKKAMNKALHDSHSRMLDNALAQRVEVTDPEKLREMYPDFTDLQITRMAKLNHKINVANDFLIEEQSAWLDLKSLYIRYTSARVAEVMESPPGRFLFRFDR